jgi:hypothetical protein
MGLRPTRKHPSSASLGRVKTARRLPTLRGHYTALHSGVKRRLLRRRRIFSELVRPTATKSTELECRGPRSGSCASIKCEYRCCRCGCDRRRKMGKQLGVGISANFLPNAASPTTVLPCLLTSLCCADARTPGGWPSARAARKSHQRCLKYGEAGGRFTLAPSPLNRDHLWSGPSSWRSAFSGVPSSQLVHHRPCRPQPGLIWQRFSLIKVACHRHSHSCRRLPWRG